MKACNECGEPKELKEFHKDKRKEDGYRHECKKCRKDKHEIKQKEKPLTISAEVERKARSSIKIHCERDAGQMIRISDCIPGCNDACMSCESKQLKNIQAGSDTLTREQETLMRHEGIRGAGYSDMIAPFAER